MDSGRQAVLGIIVAAVGIAVIAAVLAGPFPASLTASGEGPAPADLQTTGTEPWGIHLSFTEDPQTTLTVAWMTEGGADAGTTVAYGPECGSLGDTVEGSSTQLTLRPKLRVHEATITGLEPGQQIAYRAGGASSVAPCYETHTAPEEGPVQFAVYGDQGVDRGAPDVHDRILANLSELDLILVAGDLTYAEGDQSDWNAWLEMNEDLFARVPMMSAPGNHEALTPIGTEDYQEHVAQPGEEIYYSFDYANVHVLVVQSDLGQARQEGVFEEMTAFVEADLAQAQQAKENGEIDHIVVLQHHFLFSNTQGREQEPDLAAWEEQFLHRYDVNLLLTGHNHNYERSYPMAYGTPTETGEGPYVDPAGFIQIITGGGGHGLYTFNDEAQFDPHSAEHKRVYHHVELEIDGESIRGEAIQAQEDETATAGDVIDTFELIDTDERIDLPFHPADVSTSSTASS